MKRSFCADRSRMPLTVLWRQQKTGERAAEVEDDPRITNAKLSRADRANHGVAERQLCMMKACS
ncbi:hypothetical protein ACYZUA_02645 [Pseudomonas sp. LS2P72]